MEKKSLDGLLQNYNTELNVSTVLFTHEKVKEWN